MIVLCAKKGWAGYVRKVRMLVSTNCYLKKHRTPADSNHDGMDLVPYRAQGTGGTASFFFLEFSHPLSDDFGLRDDTERFGATKMIV